MDKSRRCRSCGAEVQDSAGFCGACGQSLADEHPPQASQEQPPRAGGGSWRSPPQQPHSETPPIGHPRPDGQGRPEKVTGRAGERKRPVAPSNRLGGNKVEGQARALQSRSEQRGENLQKEIWSFRIEHFDDEGNRVLLVPIEMRGLGFEGSISDGDWVRARGSYKRGTFHASEVENVTTGAVVRAKKLPFLVILLMILVAIFIIFNFLSMAF